MGQLPTVGTAGWGPYPLASHDDGRLPPWGEAIQAGAGLQENLCQGNVAYHPAGFKGSTLFAALSTLRSSDAAYRGEPHIAVG